MSEPARPATGAGIPTEANSTPASAEFTAPRMVRIPEGWFTMGSAAGQDNERPVRRVWIDAFEIAECQLSNAEYAQFLSGTGHRPPTLWGDPNFSQPLQPVVAISWYDALRYCEWLSALTGQQFRLPTEAEWERAARGGLEEKQFPWGDDPPESLANYAARWKTGPEPVGAGECNPFGLFDIGANVHEWCSDWFDANYYAAAPDRNPRGPAAGARRASRGGSWRHYTKVSRCAARSSIPPEFQYADYGFRLARDL